MLERKLHFETEMDELRQLLMREPRGHGAMSGAILQPPARPDADWGVIYIEVSGLPADVRARDDRRGDRAGGDRHGRGDRARDRDPARRPRRAWSRRAWRSRTAARKSVTIRNVAVVPARRATASSPSPASARSPTTWPTAGTSTRSRRRPTSGLVVDPVALRRADRRAGWRRWRRSTRPTRPVHPEDPRISGCRHVVFHEPGRDGADAVAATSIHPGWLDRSPCGTGTSARLAQLHARGELALGEPFVNQSVIGTRFTGRVVEEATVAGAPGDHPGDHRPRVDHRRWASTCSTPRIRSRRASL